MAEPLVVVQLTTVRSRSCTPSLHNSFPSVAESADAVASNAAARKGLSVRGGPLGPPSLGAVAQRKSASLIRTWSMDRSHPALPDQASHRYLAGIAQRQSNRLLTGRPRFRNSLPAPFTHLNQAPSSEAEQRPYKATVGISKFRGPTTLHGAAGGIGRRSALRAPCPKGHAGSTPAPRTIFPAVAQSDSAHLRSARSLGRIQPAGPTHTEDFPKDRP